MTKILNLFSSNQLKIIALVAITIDHIGFLLLPQYPILRIIGRLSFPIFAYMIAEGCRYTKNRTKYLLVLSALGVAFQVVYFVADHSLFQGVFVSFSLGIGLVYAIDNAVKRKNAWSVLLAVAVLIFIGFVCLVLPQILSHTDYKIDYGIFGVLLPSFVFFWPNKIGKLIGVAAATVGICLLVGGIQWWSLLAIVLLAMYSGERGKYKLKNLFYIYYPSHLVAIYLIDMLLEMQY